MSRTTPTADQNTDPHAASRAWASVGSRTRLAVMLLGGVAGAVVTGSAGDWGYAPLTGWDIAALIFTVWVWLAIRPMSASETATHATREDPGHAGTDLIVVIASVASLAAVGFVLIRPARP